MYYLDDPYEGYRRVVCSVDIKSFFPVDFEKAVSHFFVVKYLMVVGVVEKFLEAFD